MLTGCASISVQPGSQYATKQMPQKIYVAAFSTAHGEFNVDREGKELADFKTGLQNMMTAGTTEYITEKLVPAVALNKNKPKPRENAWLIRGQFVQVNQGSRALRGLIGFGAGGTKMLTKVEVYDLSTDDKKPFLTFSTTGGSNAEPGAILALSTDPLQLAIGGVSGAAHGLSEDAARTAREITAELSDYMYARGWISADQRVAPKHERDLENTW